MATAKSKEQRDARLSSGTMDFNKIRVGSRTLSDDVTASLDFKPSLGGKVRPDRLKRALEDHNVAELRSYSMHFFNTHGIYSRLCRYMAYLFRYDWVVTPVQYDSRVKPEKVQEGWYKSLVLLENSKLKKAFGEIALKVVRDGCYYGYKLERADQVALQDLPVKYCRSRYEVNGSPAVEFNVKFFDDMFRDTEYRMRVLKMFPQEFRQAYLAFKKGTLPKDFQGDDAGWVQLDPDKAVKFNLSSSDCPLFVQIIPALLDLDEVQGLNKKKMEQEILRLVIQKMPIDGSGDLIFDVVEAQQLHANAVSMLGKTVGVDVLTTFADVAVESLADSAANSSYVDQLNSVKSAVYDQAGVSQMQFNTDGNLALEKSIANDEATMTNLLLQFEEFGQSLLRPFNKNPKKLRYTFSFLPTTVYNYKDMSKLYKEQASMGFSKLLPQVALGQPQSTVIATAMFENETMRLNDLFVPPQLSSTVSGNGEGQPSSGGKKVDSPQGGRPEKDDDEKSEKTIQNRESMS